MILFLVFLIIICYHEMFLKKRVFHVKSYILHKINQCYMELQDLIFIIIAILVAVLLLKIFMWLLPVIVVLVIAFFIYIFLQERYS